MRITPAQRRAILALDDRQFTDYKRVMKRRDTRIKLTNGGITEPQRLYGGAITLFHSVRLTARGAALKQQLAAEQAA